MVKRFVAQGDSREWDAGPWVRISDYLLLQAAFREALDRGKEMAELLDYRIDLYRFQELRERFLKDFDLIK